jgi:hypothetical protein
MPSALSTHCAVSSTASHSGQVSICRNHLPDEAGEPRRCAAAWTLHSRAAPQARADAGQNAAARVACEMQLNMQRSGLASQ